MVISAKDSILLLCDELALVAVQLVLIDSVK